MGRNWVLILLIFVVFFCGVSSVSATPPPAKIVGGIVSNVVSALVKWLWSLKSAPKSAVSSRSMIKFENGFSVETVFDGSKLGIEPFSVDVLPNGELLVLDSENSNVYRISTPLSRYSRPKLLAGSSEGYSGHVDGKPRESRMDHPKGLTVDDRGNIYIADTKNMAIRKISDTGVTTIAGGRSGLGGGHIDGPSEDAKFSNDFDIVYIGSSCSLLVIDRGNQAVREIQLHDEDCASQYDGSFHIGIAVLVAAAFFGFMLALLQRRLRAIFSSSSRDGPRSSMKKGTPVAQYQRRPKSFRPPLIPSERVPEKSEDRFFGAMGTLFITTGSSVAEIFSGLFSGFKRKPVQLQQHYHQSQHSMPWPMQESFLIPPEDEPPPSLETRTPPARKSYPFVQTQGYYNGWDGEHQQKKPQLYQHQHQQQQQQYHHKHSNPQTYYEKSCETKEIVFGAVQEQDGRCETVVIKAVDYGDPMYNHHNIRPRFNYSGYSHNGY